MTLAGKDGIVSFLLQRGADPNCQDNGRYFGYRATAEDYALDALEALEEGKRDRVWRTPDTAHVARVKRCIELLKAAGRGDAYIYNQIYATAALSSNSASLALIAPSLSSSSRSRRPITRSSFPVS